jgi:hypothetical protein
MSDGAQPAPGELYRLEAGAPELESPVLVMAPEGWIDAGLGGGGAIATLLAGITTEVVATFDNDELLDHRARRPVARIVDGVYKDLVWPEIQLRGGRDAEGHDVLVLAGPEPDNLWRAYADAVGELAQRLGVRLMVGMGAFPAPVPHTRPAPLVATATSAELAEQVGVVRGSLDVPAGIVVALQARVPHYAAAMPYPPASVLLLEGLAQVTGITVDTTVLRQSAEAARQRLDELTANSVEHTTMVRQLEAQLEAEESSEGGLGGLSSLPTGEELAAEVERFLRDQAD